MLAVCCLLPGGTGTSPVWAQETELTPEERRYRREATRLLEVAKEEFACGQYTEAVRYAQKALSRVPDLRAAHDVIRMSRGRILKRRAGRFAMDGDIARAVETYRAALQKIPEDEDCVETLKELIRQEEQSLGVLATPTRQAQSTKRSATAGSGNTPNTSTGAQSRNRQTTTPAATTHAGQEGAHVPEKRAGEDTIITRRAMFYGFIVMLISLLALYGALYFSRKIQLAPLSKSQDERFRTHSVSSRSTAPHKIASLVCSYTQSDGERPHHIAVRFYMSSRDDILTITCYRGELLEMVAKPKAGKQGECIHWKQSDFADYSREEVLREVHDDIASVELSSEPLKKEFTSFDEFLKAIGTSKEDLFS